MESSHIHKQTEFTTILMHRSIKTIYIIILISTIVFLVYNSYRWKGEYDLFLFVLFAKWIWRNVGDISWSSEINRKWRYVTTGINIIKCLHNTSNHYIFPQRVNLCQATDYLVVKVYNRSCYCLSLFLFILICNCVRYIIRTNDSEVGVQFTSLLVRWITGQSGITVP